MKKSGDWSLTGQITVVNIAYKSLFSASGNRQIFTAPHDNKTAVAAHEADNVLQIN
jgi:hypothetical protein